MQELDQESHFCLFADFCSFMFCDMQQTYSFAWDEDVSLSDCLQLNYIFTSIF